MSIDKDSGLNCIDDMVPWETDLIEYHYSRLFAKEV